METLILTSSLDTYDIDDNGNRIPHNFGNKNDILTSLKKHIKKYDNFLFVASVENNYEVTDMYANAIIKSFDLTLPFKNYTVLDSRTKEMAEELVTQADFIFLCGGHVPTQNMFFKNINLKQLIKNTNAVVLGCSAGTMNCAGRVYCPPELDGEALNKNFKRFLDGLNLTSINILPHFQDERFVVLDGFEYMKDIILPDSYKTDIIAINDGSYIVQTKSQTTVYGEAYLISKGKVKQICKNEDT